MIMELSFFRIPTQNMRSIHHPGTPEPQRLFAVAARARPIETYLSPGQNLLSAVTRAIGPLGAQSGAFTLDGGSFTSFSYVMPALSKSPAHAVYFSETFYVSGHVALERATVTYGLRDERPWLHCHAIWVEPSGRRHCGHLLPDQVIVETPIRLTGMGLDGAAFTVSPDTETNFSLFIPQSVTSHFEQSVATQPAYALRLAPNVDFCGALETFCLEHDIQQARIVGGVGSTVGATFQEGHNVEPFVTELLIRSGRIVPGENGQVQAQIDISIVDYQGGLAEGRLAKGGNPILVTAELVLCPE